MTTNYTRKYEFVEVPKQSDWKCYLFGATEGNGVAYYPIEGHVPNRFVRWMMKVCFDCTWVKVTK